MLSSASSAFNNSPHRDVLEKSLADIPTLDSKQRLLEECKSRGRAAVMAKAWMDAKLLYEKAIEVATSMNESDKDDSDATLAILNANLSLVLQNMNDFAAAKDAATQATQQDPSYVKGWWRLGQALQHLTNFDGALKALDQAKGLEPTNKALLKEYTKVEQAAAVFAKEQAEAAAAAAMKVDSEPTTTPTATKTTTTTTSTTVTKEATKPAASSTATNTDDTKDGSNIFTKSDAVRGYKIVNGKKTSYFHNELDDQTKELIGDIAPKKIEAPTPSPTAAAAASGVSAWNKAGTWEETNVTNWAKTSLEDQLMATKYVLPDSSPAPGAKVKVTKVRTLEGHASVAQVRGKKRFIYEFLCKLDWSLTAQGGEKDLECSGSLAIPDIDGTIDMGEGYEIHDFVIDSVSDNEIRPLIDRFVHRGGFQEALNEQIDDWVRLFKKEYD